MLRIQDLKASVSNLFDEFGNTDRPLVGLAVNLTFTALGIVAYLTLGQSGGLLGVAAAWGGVGLAAISLGAIVAWVVGL